MISQSPLLNSKRGIEIKEITKVRKKGKGKCEIREGYGG
jgi:hypothetical protein